MNCVAHAATSSESCCSKEFILKRYRGNFAVPPISYGTVRDYCDSCDYLPGLSTAQNDLKDLQRPWTLKAALGLTPPGGSLLEIGAGEPFVAALLSDLGYNVTVVDPYDGSGRGPTAFKHFVRKYPKVRIVKAELRDGLIDLQPGNFDGIYSISVLEHITEPSLGAMFQAIKSFLRPGGWSFHAMDCVIEGTDAGYHRQQCFNIANYLDQLAGGEVVTHQNVEHIIQQAIQDIDTFYLSAAGHNLWRGGLPYEKFPFRKVISIQFLVRRPQDHS
ncbi:MAG: class I SAM-dependent methyltransferase [Verrucomicrobia bacterium]|nr:class I SAM-dependent methyltransferase [Verrucomicrobiota bacterium]